MSDLELSIDRQTNPAVRKLEELLANPYLETPKSCSFTNIFNQASGKSYAIPFTVGGRVTPYYDTEKDVTGTGYYLQDMLDENRDQIPIDRFFAAAEECRRTKANMYYAERQYFHYRPPRASESAAPSDTASNAAMSTGLPVTAEDAADGLEDLDDAPAADEPDEIPFDHSCIELDFDIYQRTKDRWLDEMKFQSLCNALAKLLEEILDFAALDPSGTGTRIYFAILRKDEVREENHKTYKHCFKESFHLRIFIRVSREVKIYFVRQIKEKGILAEIFTGTNVINPWDTVLDAACTTYPAMLLGSMKRNGKEPHNFYVLYYVNMKPNSYSLYCEKATDFDPIPYSGPAIKRKDPTNARRMIAFTPPPTYKHNLCYELSLCFEAPGGLIRKPTLRVKKSFEELIQAHIERTRDNLISADELDDTQHYVADLTVRNYEAKYVQGILEILKPERCATYEDWKSIICILARANPEYKSLAIWFSQRCPHSWVKDGLRQLESIWEWALANRSESERGLPTLYHWAREDNPVRYDQLQQKNSFAQLKAMSEEHCGQLNESHFAKLLKGMWGQKFVTDMNSLSRSKERIWYEFVFPGDNVGRKVGMNYKWLERRDAPDTLYLFISQKLPNYLGMLLDWIKERKQQQGLDENALGWLGSYEKNLGKTKFSLGKHRNIIDILKACERWFSEPGFIDSLDNDERIIPNVLGVGNGVLRLFPTTEMIERYHNIPISRSTRVDYVPYNSDDPTTKMVEMEIRRLFCDDQDAYEFTMCYLASTLDGRKKNPLFFIWLGEGSNGKSFLLELHINTLLPVVKGGYGSKLNVAFFTQDRKNGGGPDSEKMTLKYTRFAYCSESEAGDTLRMARIKEMTGETLTGNDKNEKQDMFEANCHYVFASNHDPRITGSDYGTWRRVIVYRFKLTMKDNPDPNNRFEHKRDIRFISEYPKDPNVRRAYLSLLVHWYGILRDRYGGDLNRVPKPTIDEETLQYQNQQDTISRFVYEQVKHIGETFKNGEKVPHVSLVEMATRYTEWHRKKIDDSTPHAASELIRMLRNSRIKKWIIEKGNNNYYLTQHVVLKIGEEYTEPTGTPIAAKVLPDLEAETRSVTKSETVSFHAAGEELYDDLDESFFNIDESTSIADPEERDDNIASVSVNVDHI